jgi:hypothetical protein
MKTLDEWSACSHLVEQAEKEMENLPELLDHWRQVALWHKEYLTPEDWQVIALISQEIKVKYGLYT